MRSRNLCVMISCAIAALAAVADTTYDGLTEVSDVSVLNNADGKHFAADIFANTTAPANAAAVFATKYTVGPMPARSTSTLNTFLRYSGIATEKPTSAPTEKSMPAVIASTYGSFSIAKQPAKVVCDRRSAAH